MMYDMCMNEEVIFYSKCHLCPDYYKETTSVHKAKEDIEAHEKEKHNGKLVGIFGWKKHE